MRLRAGAHASLRAASRPSPRDEFVAADWPRCLCSRSERSAPGSLLLCVPQRSSNQEERGSEQYSLRSPSTPPHPARPVGKAGWRSPKREPSARKRSGSPPPPSAQGRASFGQVALQPVGAAGVATAFLRDLMASPSAEASPAKQPKPGSDAHWRVAAHQRGGSDASRDAGLTTEPAYLSSIRSFSRQTSGARKPNSTRDASPPANNRRRDTDAPCASPRTSAVGAT
jgi:hypothetical protein